jgi:two-component system, NarL family, sensor kinase
VRTVKPHNPSASSFTRHGTAELPVVSGAIADPLAQARCEVLLFAVHPLRDGRFVYEAVNQTFEALLGVSSRDLPGLDILHCLGWEDAQSVCVALQACLAEETEVRIHHSLTLGGLRRNVETIVIPIADPAIGVIIRLIGTHRILLKDSPEDDPDETADLRNSVSLAAIQDGIQQRIASELHDSTCQHLVAASLGLVRIRTWLGSAKGHEHLCDQVVASIDEAMREIRSLTYVLHPQALMVEGLKATIERYAHGFAARTMLRVTVGIDASVDQLPDHNQHSLLRIVQEGLTNVFRHAHATEVSIVTDITDRTFRLTIGDNGRGFPVWRENDSVGARSMGVGIPAMRARVEQLGGKLEIRSDPTKPHSGTTLCVVLPHSVRPKGGKRRSSLQS